METKVLARRFSSQQIVTIPFSGKLFSQKFVWETDFYTSPVLRGAALCRFQRQRCITFTALRAQDFHTPLALKTAKGQRLAALEVYKNQSPIVVRVCSHLVAHSLCTAQREIPAPVFLFRAQLSSVFMLVPNDYTA